MASTGCKVVKVVVSENLLAASTTKETVKAGLTVAKAVNLREKLNAAQEKEELRASREGTPLKKIVAYMVEGTI